MTPQVSFSKAARAELFDAATCYESKRPRLGVEFIAEVDRCLALAVGQPQIYSVVYRDLRRIFTGGSRMEFTFKLPSNASSWLRSFTAAETLQSGKGGPGLTMEPRRPDEQL